MTIQEQIAAYNQQRSSVDPLRMTGIRFQSADDYRSAAGNDPRRLVNCDLKGLDLREIDLSYCIFDACNLSSSRLGSCHHAQFYSCDLRQAKLTGADFRWAKAKNCRIDGADLLGIQTTIDCHFWSGLRSDLAQDAYLLLFWMGGATPLTQALTGHIPTRVRVFLERQFARDLA